MPSNIKMACGGLIIVFLICTTYFLYSYGYNKGTENCRVEAAAQMKQIREANETAIDAARSSLLQKIEVLQTQKKRLEDEISIVDKKATADPDANTCGISINSVRRINAIR